MTGAYTNATFFVGAYDPSLPVPYWHQRMELVTICVCNSFTREFIIPFACVFWLALSPASKSWGGDNSINQNSLVLLIVARIWYRWARMKHFRFDDGWMAVAGVCNPFQIDSIARPKFRKLTGDSFFSCPIGLVKSVQMCMVVGCTIAMSLKTIEECTGMYVVTALIFLS
jgi:hypothetical protein